MTKKRENFEITYPLTQQVVRGLKNVTDHVGDLICSGTAYMDTDAPITEPFERFSVDIDFVRWNGTDIKPVLEVTGAMDDIELFCTKAAASLFTENIRRAS